ncbi:ferredoxin-1 [Lentzea guizhouensis]|uniref:Ferredoxin n=1 Tax=Lentzea guizhouensis TaxID=1586287 RepID=A0A1B2HX85_9PSEU|nr:ferredoxin [Lentzea guizhouensis]ANZ42370.1 ferredoxin-1 [Lentzea guizhouensis]
MAQISVDTGKCIGSAQCVLAAPEVFDQDDDGFVTVLDASPSGEAAASARTAQGICPAQAISVQG